MLTEHLSDDRNMLYNNVGTAMRGKDKTGRMPTNYRPFGELRFNVDNFLIFPHSRCVSGVSRRSGRYALGTLHTGRRGRDIGRRWDVTGCGSQIGFDVLRCN